MALVDTAEAHVTGVDIALAATLTNDAQITFIGFNRASTESISITISITIGTTTSILIALTTSDVTDISITDQFKLPPGAIVSVTTSGVSTGKVDAVVISDGNVFNN